MIRKINAVWNGNGADGSGTLTAQSGAFDSMPYSFKTRFENDDGQLGTNPEHLIPAALRGYFNIKLSFVLNESNISPEELNTTALLVFEDGNVLSIELALRGKVPNITKEKFHELSIEAKNNCPISGVLNCEISLNASLI